MVPQEGTQGNTLATLLSQLPKAFGLRVGFFCLFVLFSKEIKMTANELSTELSETFSIFSWTCPIQPYFSSAFNQQHTQSHYSIQ